MMLSTVMIVSINLGLLQLNLIRITYHGGLEEHLYVDESMIPYYGRHYAKQFIRGKPIRFGFKNWAICSSTGYMIAFEIYTGKSDVEKSLG